MVHLSLTSGLSMNRCTKDGIVLTLRMVASPLTTSIASRAKSLALAVSVSYDSTVLSQSLITIRLTRARPNLLSMEPPLI